MSPRPDPARPAVPGQRAEPGPAELRRGLLMVSVLGDVDLEPGDDGVVLPGRPPVHVSWAECRVALGGHEPEGGSGRERLGRWLRARRWAADLPATTLTARLRPVGLPVGHLLHPGRAWVQERVLGDALDLGLGALGLDPADPDGVVLLPPPALAGVDVPAAWLRASALLEELGALAATLVARDAQGRLRPVGDCDAVTLLGSARLRGALAGTQGGMAGAVVPMRRRGWTRLALVDPAFGGAAAAATDPVDQGFPRPLLLTADEVTLVAEGGRPELLVLDRSAGTRPPDRVEGPPLSR